MSTNIEDCLREMDHHDPDNRQMASIDLAKALNDLSEKETINASLERRVSAAFIKHLNDKNLNVQSAAVNAIQRTAGLLNESNLLQLSQTLGETVSDPKATQDSRAVFSNAIRCIINEFKVDDGARLIKDLLPRLQKGLQTPNANVQEECLEIMVEIFSKFAVVFEQERNLVNKDKLVSDLVAMLENSDPKVGKKAALCLGSTAVILSQSQLDNLVKTLRAMTDDFKTEDELLAILTSLSNITRTTAARLSSSCSDMISELSAYPTRLQNESKDMDNDISEAALSSIENLVKMNPTQVSSSIGSLFDLTKSLIAYDPNFAGGDEDEDEAMEADDDDGWGDDVEADDDGGDVDDTAWKVRKGAVKIIDALAISCGPQLKKQWQEMIELLTSRFTERDGNVKCEVLGAFQSLIRASVQADEDSKLTSMLALVRKTTYVPQLRRANSSTYNWEDRYENVIQELKKYLTSKNSTEVRVTTWQTLSVMSTVMLDKLSENLPELVDPMKELPAEGNTEMITYALQILKQSFKNTDEVEEICMGAQEKKEVVCEFLGEVIQFENQNKIVSEALYVTGNFVKQLVGLEGCVEDECKDEALSLYAILLKILKNQNVPHEVKQSCIVAMAKLVGVAYPHLSSEQFNEVFKTFGDRTSAELTRESALRAMNILASNEKIKIDLAQYADLPEKLLSLMNQVQRSVQLWTLELIHTLLVKYPTFMAGSASDFMKAMEERISVSDIQRALFALRCTTELLKMKAEGSDSAVAAAITLCAQPKDLNQEILQHLSAFFRTATQVGFVSQKETDALMEQCTLQTRTCAKMSAVILSASGQSDAFVPTLLEQVNKYLTTDSAKVIAAILTLGEIGATKDMAAVPAIIETISSLFSNEHDQVRQAAAICLGCISSGNTNFFVEKVFTLIENSEANTKYMYMATIKEIIIIKPECLVSYLDKLMPLYVNQSKSADASIMSIVSESLGRLYVQNSDKLKPALLEILNAADLAATVTAMKSIKYSAYKNHDAKAFAEFVPKLIAAIQSPDLGVQQSALEALGAIANSSSLHDLLKPQKHPQLVEFALQRTPMDPKLVVTTDLGAFKVTKDQGAPIRKASFVLLQSMCDAFRTGYPPVVSAVIEAVADTDEDVQLQAMVFLGKLLDVCPMMLVAQLDAIIEKFTALITKMTADLKKGTQTERQNGQLRGILRVCSALKKNPEAASNPSLSDWFKRTVTGNTDVPQIKDLYEKIVDSQGAGM